MTSRYDKNIPDEDFHLSHAVDRELYSRLTINLTRDPEESVQVMAFLTWLQYEVCKRKGVLAKLLELPDLLLNEIAIECVACLRCVHNGIPPSTEGVYEISLLPKLTGLNVALRVLHEYRLEVLGGVNRFLRDVCFRAFGDIFARVSEGKLTSPAAAVSNSKVIVRAGSENMEKTLGRANEGNGLLKSSLDYERIFAPSVEDRVRNPALAIGGCTAGGFNVAPQGIKQLNVEIGGKDISCSLDELTKIFTPLSINKFGLHGDQPGGNKITPVVPTPVWNNPDAAVRASLPPLQQFAGSFEPYHPLPPPSLGYVMIPTADPERGLLATPPTGRLPAPSWANPTPENASGYARIPPSPPPRQAHIVSYNPQSGGMCDGHPYSSNDVQKIYVNYNDLDDLLPDDRTVFLTFSRGYPVAASDLTEHFTRKFGNDAIERMYMQIVGPNEMVIYARIVCSSPAVMRSIIKGGNAKYTIRGRHCWARKNIKKIRTLAAANSHLVN